MQYGDFINFLRSQVGDTKKRVHIDFPTDGITNVFQMPDDTFPVLDDEATYTVRVDGSPISEGGDYELDKRAGTLTLVSTPNEEQTLTLDSIKVNVINEDWMFIINSTIRGVGKDFFKEFTDENSILTVGGQREYDLTNGDYSSDLNACIAVYEFQHRRSASENWVTVETYANWRHDADNNIIYIGDQNAFSQDGEAFRVRGLRGYTTQNDINEDIDVQERFLTVIEYGAIARYWRWRYKDVVELVSKMTQESSRTPLQELIMLSDRFDRLYEVEKGKLKPQKPPRILPRYKEGSPRP